MGVSSVCVEDRERTCVRLSSACERGGGGRSSVGRSVGGRSAGAAPKVRTPHNDVGNDICTYENISIIITIIISSTRP